MPQGGKAAAGSGEPTVGALGQVSGDTCHIDVVDKEGNMVACTRQVVGSPPRRSRHWDSVELAGANVLARRRAADEPRARPAAARDPIAVDGPPRWEAGGCLRHPRRRSAGSMAEHLFCAMRSMVEIYKKPLTHHLSTRNTSSARFTRAVLTRTPCCRRPHAGGDRRWPARPRPRGRGWRALVRRPALRGW